MARQLRPRTSRPSYAALAGFQDEADVGEAGPSIVPDFDEADSGSDFAPEKKKNKEKKDDEEEEDDDETEEDEDDNDNDDLDEDVVPSSDEEQVPLKRRKSSITSTSISKTPTKAKSLLAVSSSRGAGFGPSKRQMYVLPTPSVHHRHKAIPLYVHTGKTERLTSPPKLFDEPSLAYTNNFTHSPRVTDRVNKAWGYNVGSGPLWELVEDRGWFKEGQVDLEKEENRRPIVYENIGVMSGWQLLNAGDAAPYLPTDTTATEEGNLKPPPPITCSFGPINEQRRVKLHMFQSLKLGKLMPGSGAHVFNAGAPAWGLDWCPIHTSDRRARNHKKYLAVATFPSKSHSPDIGVRTPRPFPSCIQIWSLGLSSDSSSSSDVGEMMCEMVVCHDSGPAHDLKWCPLPSHDSFTKSATGPRKLGLIAGTFEDGSLSFFVIPEPSDVTSVDQDSSQPVFVKLSDPILRIELDETLCWTFDWANSETIAIGTTHGIIAVYNLGEALRTVSNSDTPPLTDLFPTHYLSVHQSAVRAISWIRAPPSLPSGLPRTDGDPMVIASGGYDGMECLMDVREGHGSVMNRTRDVINTMAYSPYSGGPITIDHENMVKAYSASPSMLGRGHSLMEPQGPVWSVSVSDWHPQLVVGSADGSCTTTNMLRSTRRGGSVPFFIHKIYQLDYSRNSQEYRMLEKFLPQETQDRPSAARYAKSQAGKNKKKETIKANPVSTGAWSREVGVHLTKWNNGNGPNGAGLLASATSSGLCRVDNLWGRWMKDKMPYGNVPKMRTDEGIDDMDVDSEESE